jgi:pyruvate/2-oxoglutarate dehydrogenase complex dihydrolipoamide acyltransferase (E2) component
MITKESTTMPDTTSTSAPTAGTVVEANAGVRATASVRALANRLGVRLANVPGTGVCGRIRPHDVRAAARPAAPAAPTLDPLYASIWPEQAAASAADADPLYTAVFGTES